MVSDTGVLEEKIRELFVTFWLPVSLRASSLWRSGSGAGKGRKPFSQLSGIFLAQKQPLASRNYSQSLKILAKNILLSKNKSTRQQPPTPNFEYLAEKHVMLYPINYNMFFPHIYMY